MFLILLFHVFFRDGQEGVFQRSGGSVFTRGSVFAYIVRGTFRQRGSIHHDEHVIAKFRFSQEVRRDDDGDAFFRQGVDAQPEVAPGQGVRSGSGFVQKRMSGEWSRAHAMLRRCL